MSLLRTQGGRHWFMEDEGMPLATRKLARRLYKRKYDANVRRVGRKKADEKWKGNSTMEQASPFKLNSDTDVIAAAMITGYLAVGHSGFPGYAFISDEALRDVFGLFLRLRKQPAFDMIRSIRKRLHLKKAEILYTGLRKGPDGTWELLGVCGGTFGFYTAKGPALSTGIAPR
ncbi:MAG: hypothetical protein ACLQU3_08190 [Limisphaerales bacterium]